MGCQESRAVWKTGESIEKTGQQEPRLGVGVSTGHHFQAKKLDRVWLEVRSLTSQDLWVTRPEGGITAVRAERAFIHLFIEDEKLIKGRCFELPAPSPTAAGRQVWWADTGEGSQILFFHETPGFPATGPSPSQEVSPLAREASTPHRKAGIRRGSGWRQLGQWKECWAGGILKPHGTMSSTQHSAIYLLSTQEMLCGGGPSSVWP